MKRPGHKYLLFFLDGLLVNSSFFCAIGIHGYLTGDVWFRSPSVLIPELLFWLTCSTVTMFVFITSDVYRINIYLSTTEQIYAIVKATTTSLIAIVVMTFFVESATFSTSKIILVSFVSIATCSLLIGRLVAFRKLFEYFRRHRRFQRNALIVGAGPTGRRMADVLGARNPFALNLVGILDDKLKAGSFIRRGVPVLGRMEELNTIVGTMKVDEVIACPEHGTDDEFVKLLESLTKIRARVLIGSPDYRVIPEYNLQERYDGVPMFGIENSPPYMGLPALKRFMDLTLAIIATILLLPLLIAIAILIKLDSPGPALFRQTRIGKDGKPFTFYKFRSMTLGSDVDPRRMDQLREFIQNSSGESGKSTKIVDEQRVTNVGRFLRKTSLDELPQLYNVIRGEMSLVGPRPCLPYEWEHYTEWQKKRLSVTPGCTGLWQVAARSKVGFRDMVILDVFYANNRSFHFDLWLIMKTVPVMIFGNGGK